MDSWLYGGAIVLTLVVLLWDSFKSRNEGDAWHDYRPKKRNEN